MRTADVLVIGAGVLGTFHAYFAARKGYKTLLLERNTLPNDASTRNFGMIAQSIAEGGAWSEYARATAEIYRQIQAEWDISARPTGSLYVASTELEARVLHEFADRAAPRYSCSYLDAAEVRYRYPFVRESYGAAALLFPDDLTVEPTRMLRQLLPYSERTAPVEYVPNTTVVSVARSGQGCLATDAAGRTYAADRVIVCGGAEYRTLFPERLAASGLRLCKLQMLQTVPQKGFSLPHALLSGLSIKRYPAFKICPSYAALQEQQADDHRIGEYGIHLLFRQAADGSVVVGDSHEYRELGEAAGLEERTSPAINEAILGYGRGMIELPSWEIASLWNGYYLLHPEREIFTETIGRQIHIVTGIGGKGMTTGVGSSRAHIDALLG